MLVRTRNHYDRRYRDINPDGARWVFTINNPTQADKDAVATFLADVNHCRYGVVGREVGAAGTPHLQGFIILTRNKRRNAVQRHLGGRAHLDKAQGTSAQAATYCKKDGDFDEYGTRPEKQGKRSDLEEILEWAETFTEERGRAPDSPDIAQERPRAYLQYPRLRRLFGHRAPQVQLEFGEPKQWQLDLEAELQTAADDRTIVFYVDNEGGKGKSWFCRYYLTNHPASTQILSSGKRADIAHCIDINKSVFLFNVPRGGMEYFDYTVAEQIKDRLIFSGKYDSRMKVMNNKSHVVVFCNEMPDLNKMSADRYVIREAA